MVRPGSNPLMFSTGARVFKSSDDSAQHTRLIDNLPEERLKHANGLIARADNRFKKVGVC